MRVVYECNRHKTEKPLRDIFNVPLWKGIDTPECRSCKDEGRSVKMKLVKGESKKNAPIKDRTKNS